jgi:hypothetical protein
MDALRSFRHATGENGDSHEQRDNWVAQETRGALAGWPRRDIS